MAFIAFEVEVNGERVSCAGGPDVSVLSGVLTLSQRQAQGDLRVVELRVGGLISATSGEEPEHLDWVRLKDVPVGTEITFRVVNATEADPPSRRYFFIPKS